MTIILTIIGIFLIILEVLTISTLFIWIGIGFIVAGIISLFVENIVIIALVGMIATLLSIKIFKPRYMKSILPNGTVKTSYNELIGKNVKMLEDYEYDGTNTATAIINSVVWTVQADQINVSFKEDELVSVKEINGAKLIIQKGV